MFDKKEWSRKYYQSNKKRILECGKRWWKNNPEKTKKYRINSNARSREWYYKNREYVIQREREYRKRRYEKYPWLRTYENIQARVNNKPEYIRYGIKNLLTKEDIKFLWIRDKASSMIMPSIDRKDGYKNYTLENCQFIELTDNLRKPRAWRRKDISLRNLKGYPK